MGILHLTPAAAGNNVDENRKQVQIRLAIIMSVTVFEFMLFQLPGAYVVLSAFYGQISGNLIINSKVSTFCFSLWYIDAIINPLWMVPLAKGRRRSGETYSRSFSLSIKSPTSAIERN